MGVSLLNFFDLKPLNTSKRALNTNPPFFWDTLYIYIYSLYSLNFPAPSSHATPSSSVPIIPPAHLCISENDLAETEDKLGRVTDEVDDHNAQAYSPCTQFNRKNFAPIFGLQDKIEIPFWCQDNFKPNLLRFFKPKILLSNWAPELCKKRMKMEGTTTCVTAAIDIWWCPRSIFSQLLAEMSALWADGKRRSFIPMLKIYCPISHVT